MHPADLKEYVEILSTAGVPLIICFVLIYLGIKKGPQWIDKYLETQKTIAEQTPKAIKDHTQAIQDQTTQIKALVRNFSRAVARLGSMEKHDSRVRAAWYHLAIAVERFVKELVKRQGYEIGSDVLEELEESRRKLNPLTSGDYGVANPEADQSESE